MAPQKFSHEDHLWNETLELGPEGLIATVEDLAELIQKLREVAQKRADLIQPED